MSNVHLTHGVYGIYRQKLGFILAILHHKSQVNDVPAVATPAYEANQAAINTKAPDGEVMRTKKRLVELRKRSAELEEQVRQLEQTISHIHLYRKTEGLPELRVARDIYASASTSDPKPTLEK